MRVAAIVISAGLVAGGAGLAATTSSATAPGQDSHQRLVDWILARVAPGARGHILDGATLQIILPPGSGGPARRNDTPVWRASLAADELALRLPSLKQWTIPGDQTNSLSDVRQPPGDARLDSLSPSAARRQLIANLYVLDRGLPASAHLRVHTSTIPLDVSQHRFAFLVDLSVARLGALRHYLGDLLLGPGTGLTGGVYRIEGQAVVVHDAHGHLLGAWGNARGESALDYGPGGGLNITLPFRDQQGKPPPGASHG
jgi:hypothetical protein